MQNQPIQYPRSQHPSKFCILACKQQVTFGIEQEATACCVAVISSAEFEQVRVKRQSSSPNLCISGWSTACLPAEILPSIPTRIFANNKMNTEAAMISDHMQVTL